MLNKDEIFVSLRENFKKLVTTCDKLRGENASLKSQLRQLQEELSQKERNFAELESKYSILKTAKSLVAGEKDPHEAKLQINRIVREIDNCIALLNR